MASAIEAATAKPQLGAGLAQGVETLSGNEQITFTLYVKLVLPLDGYVFWVNASLLTDSAIHPLSGKSEKISRQTKQQPARTIVRTSKIIFCTHKL